MELVYTSEVRPEPTMEVNAFSKTQMSIGLKALATRIINLLLQEKGTVSNAYDMGAGLGMFLFEFMDDDTLAKIRYEVQGQISKYLPDVGLQDVQIENGDADLAKSLIIKLGVNAKSLPITDLFFIFTQKSDGRVVAEAYL